MAIFLSRIKRALNLGTKTITSNGTYNASSDGYDGYSSVEVNVSGGSAIPITPSNSNPPALSSGVAVEPTTNGYAIESFDSVTPSSTPASVASGDIVKIGGNGVIVDNIPSPTSITPSDSTPPQLTQGNIYEPTANGYLYASNQSPTETVLWTNNSPTSSQSVGDITLSDDMSKYDYLAFKWWLGTSDDTTNTSYMKVTDFMTKTLDSGKNVAQSIYAYTGSGNAKVRPINYVNNTTIHLRNAQNLAATGTANTNCILVEVKGISVALPPSVGNVKTGYVQLSTSTTTEVNLGFKPKYICLTGMNNSNTPASCNVYNEDAMGSNKAYNAGSGAYVTQYTLPNTANYRINSITNTGFIMNKSGSSSIVNYYYFALG